MNATRDAAVALADYGNSSVDTADTTDAQIEQRAINMRAFQRKYDAMLNLIEFMASLNMVGIKNIRHEKKMNELKLLLAETRDKLGLYQAGEIQLHKCAASGKAGARG